MPRLRSRVRVSSSAQVLNKKPSGNRGLFAFLANFFWKTWYLWNAGGSACRFGMAAALFREDRSFPNNSPGGGIGRRAGLKIQWAVMPVRVRFPSRVQIFQRRFRGCENAFLFIAIVKPTPYYQFLNHELSKDDPIAEENRKVLDPLTFPRPKAFNLYVLPSHLTDAAFALSN